MNLIFGVDDAVAKYVSHETKVNICPPYTAIGVLDDKGNLRGGVVYNHYNGADIEVSVAGKGCWTRGIVRAVLHYPFEQLGVVRVTAKTRRSNHKVQKILARFGGVFEGVRKHHYGPLNRDDAFVYRMERGDVQKWLKGL